MSDYSNYKAADLLLDQSFLNYCKNIPADTAYWEAKLAEHPVMESEINRAKKLYQVMAVTISTEEKQAAAHKLKLAIASDSRQPYTMRESAPVYNIGTRKRSWLIKMIAAAAIIAVIVSAAFWFYPHSDKYNTPVADFATATFRELIEAKDNQRKQVQLPDGSVAVLNYGSILKIAENYDQSTRWVFLEGEAFFSVKPDAEKPFVVITDKTATSALGTSFKVRNYPGEELSNVMLATGKVKVQAMLNKNSQPDIMLLPSEEGTCQKNNQLIKSRFDLEILNDWRNMKIIFDKASLVDIIKTLEFYYGVQVRLQNRPATEIAFTGKFFEKSLRDVLEAISFTNKFRYTQTGNTVSILFQ